MPALPGLELDLQLGRNAHAAKAAGVLCAKSQATCELQHRRTTQGLEDEDPAKDYIEALTRTPTVKMERVLLLVPGHPRIRSLPQESLCEQANTTPIKESQGIGSGR